MVFPPPQFLRYFGSYLSYLFPQNVPCEVVAITVLEFSVTLLWLFWRNSNIVGYLPREFFFPSLHGYFYRTVAVRLLASCHWNWIQSDVIRVVGTN